MDTLTATIATVVSAQTLAELIPQFGVVALVVAVIIVGLVIYSKFNKYKSKK